MVLTTLPAPGLSRCGCRSAGLAGQAGSLGIAPDARARILALGILVLAAELLNAAIEETVDHVSREEHAMARKAKDCVSAGVALAAIAGGVAWAAVLPG